MSDWNLPMNEDSIWNHFGDECDRRNDLLYDICTPSMNDLEDVDRMLGCDFGFGSQSEALHGLRKCRDSSDGEIKSQSAVRMEVDDSDIAAVVKSSFQSMNTGNSSDNCKMLKKRYSSTATRNEPADHTNRSTYGLDQIQIFEDKDPLPPVLPSDHQPCSSGLSSKKNHCNTGNPQFQLDNRLLPDQFMGRLFDPSSKPPPPSHGQELHNALMAEFRHGQASCSTFENERQRTRQQHQHEGGGGGGGGGGVEATGSLELPPFNADLTAQECARSFAMDSTAQETSCMKQVFSNDVNPEATNLLQLHNVMNEMDVAARRCISNSLYRLARSSMKRPNLSDLSNGSSESVFARSSKRLAGGTDANTNLLDQSVAKLLFYKPFDLAISSSAEAMLHKSGMLIGIPL
ncbi:protein LNK1-like isoform X2 [Iris pallida]|uniref:Protein LNK1-like isoform X2 n=1 Tax=Iris pallida TaxID=29817 RepID=A0AAX6GW75_IRIPA|nr:protein LNK1-like isoform X2 [Iris pallida]